MDARAISFGPFRLLAAQRLLLEGDKPVRLGSRAFDILAALVERAGEVVGKEELIARAWPETFVEESNLKIQVSALRRALGDGQGGHRYVVTVPGRGYNFVAPVKFEQPPRVPVPPTIASDGGAQSAGGGNSDDRPRGSRGGARLAAFARAPGDNRRARRHRQDHGRPRRRRAHDREL